MSIKLRIILLSLIGNIAIAAVFLTLAQYQTSQKDQAAIESSATVYGQAWRTVLNDSFDNSVGFFHPQSGDMDKITIWQVDTTAEDPPVLVDFLETEEVGVDLKEYLDQYFEDAFGWGELSFVMLLMYMPFNSPMLLDLLMLYFHHLLLTQRLLFLIQKPYNYLYQQHLL